MRTSASEKLFKEAKMHMPGGVNSPVRAFSSVGLNPVFIKKSKGAYVWDEDDNRYIDYVSSWGPMILGHAHPRVVKAIQETAAVGTSYGACCEQEIELSKLVKKFVPSIEMVRMVNSGTEATMSALRLARAFTGRNKIIKFRGCYHGHADSFLADSGSGVVTLSLPDSPGVTPSTVSDTLNANYNDIQSVYDLIEKNRHEIAGIIVEPVSGNMGCVSAHPEFLEALRKVCSEEDILLIFDEVMTGFRLARGGAQELYGITPDLTTLGKILGGGIPIGAFGGRADVMKMVAPSGAMYQAGTFSGNPLAMSAGCETLRIIEETENFYSRIEEKATYLAKGISDGLKANGLDFRINQVGSMITLFFTNDDVVDFETAKRVDKEKFARFFRGMFQENIYLPPSQFEAWFVSDAHSKEILQHTIDACEISLATLRA